MRFCPLSPAPNDKSIRSGITDPLEAFNLHFGSEAAVQFSSFRGRVLEFEFSGQAFKSCCASSYFDNFIKMLEESKEIAYSILEVSIVEGNAQPHYDVKIIKMDFLDEICSAIKKVEATVKKRLEDFEITGKEERLLFNEMCFCILTANFTAEGGMRIQEQIGDGFGSLTQRDLARKLKSLGYRFPTSRASYICENRFLYGSLNGALNQFKDGWTAREWLVKTVKGLGYKEASHFLRNVGFTDVAIIDRHILKYLKERGLIEMPKTFNRKRYLEMEKILLVIAKKLNLNLAELDLYLWYIMTGKILK
jgi:N-glycosylase/DNA lyase